MHAEAAFSSEFPSVLVDDTEDNFATVVLPDGDVPSSSRAAGAMRFVAGLKPAKREEHEQLVELQKQVLQLLHIHFAPSGDVTGLALAMCCAATVRKPAYARAGCKLRGRRQ